MRSILQRLPNRRRFVHGQDTLKVGCPWLTPGAIMALELEILRPEFSVMETGSGGSTVFFSRLCRTVKALECDPEWYLLSAERMKKIANITLVDTDAVQMLGLIAAEPNHSFDLVLVDHRDPAAKRTNRLPAAEAALPKIKHGGWLVVDNYADFGMHRFNYDRFDYRTYDDWRWSGRGTRICKVP